MIYCIWYPSGGFGHFVNAVLSLYGKNFARPSNTKFTFSGNGNSHNLDLVAPKYLHEPTNYHFDFDPELNYSVLIDNGINNSSIRYRQFFSGAKTIKICYCDFTWPIIAVTMIEKAMNKLLNQTICVDSELWHNESVWAQREKYFLYLRDHELRNQWQPDKDCYNLSIQNILHYDQMYQSLLQAKIVVDCFEDLWKQWHQRNLTYLQPVIVAKRVMEAVQKRENWSLISVTSVWDQAVIYYYIWVLYGFEVPHNDYANWFTNTTEIVTMLDKHGVSIDSNT